MKKGEVWEAELGGKIGKRPVLVLTRSHMIPYLSKIVVAEITSQGKGYPTQVDIAQSANLKKHSFVSSEALHTIPKNVLVRYLGDLPETLLQQVNEAITFALDLNS